MFALIWANAVSWTGNVAALIALPWFVLETTGSAAKTGLTGAALGVGTVATGIFGGPLVDRLGFKRTSVLADVASGTTVALIPLLYMAGALEFWALLGLVFLSASLDAPGASARFALVPDLARRAGMPLERANSAFGAVPRLALLVGSPLAGVLIAAFGAANVLLLNAATFVVSAALVALLVPSPERPAQEILAGEAPRADRAADAPGYLAELSAGMRFVQGSPLVLSVLLVVTFVNLLDEPLVSVVLPVYAKNIWESAVGLGLVFGAVGAGALAGTATFGIFGHRLPRRTTFLVALLAGGGLQYCVLLAGPSLAVTVAAFALGGFLFGPLDPIFSTILQEHTPKEMLGRVFGLTRALVMGGTPLGVALGGFLVEGVGLTFTLVAMTGCFLMVTLGTFLNPTMREMDTLKDAKTEHPGEPSSEDATDKM